MAYKSGLQYESSPIDFHLHAPQTELFGTEQIYQKQWLTPCETCGSRLICNDCQKYGKCIQK